MTLMCRSSTLQDECEEISNAIARIPGWDSLVQAIDEGDSNILDDLISAVHIYAFNQTFYLAKRT
jgi:hypothetical protein